MRSAGDEHELPFATYRHFADRDVAVERNIARHTNIDAPEVAATTI